MYLDEVKISRAIADQFFKKFADSLECDVAVVGGGPAGLTAAYYLGKSGTSVVLLERKIALGGGMWGGGMMFNSIVVQEEGKGLLDEFGVGTSESDKGYYCADSVEASAAICHKAASSGAKIFNLVSAEDVVLVEDRVIGLVINWSAVQVAKLHVDPLTLRSKYVIDATGHSAEIARIIQDKSGRRLKTETGALLGEGPMWADVGERSILENTREFFPGVYAAGLCCNVVFGGPRMGPIFGGMLLSGKKAAETIVETLSRAGS
jgi:thiazole biosynthesis enzyme